ncbi:MAG: PqqD family protein [Marinilabiliales bacterium]|nr:PqqD family protein [Marinilabiliales bacterium]
MTGRKSVKDIIEAVISEYETDYDTASSDVFGFMEEMSKYLIITGLPAP